MWIGSYKLQKNEIPPYYAIEMLKIRINDLYQKLEREMGKDYQLSLEFSRHNEAAYISISNQIGTYVVSIRNHFKRPKAYDKGIYLWLYRTWEECEDHFFRIDLPYILGKINTLRVVK